MTRELSLLDSARYERRRTLVPKDARDEAYGDWPSLITKDMPRLDRGPLDEFDRDWSSWAVRIVCMVLAVLGFGLVFCFAAVAVALYLAGVLGATPLTLTLIRDDGRYAESPLKAWFDRLSSGKGLCCSFADGFSIQDVDWDTQEGRYRVRLGG